MGGRLSAGRKPGPRQWAFAIAMVLVPMVLLLGTPHALRALAMGEAERDALALMEVPPAPLEGDNAFLWLATASHDVPEAELQAAIDEDNEAFKAWLDDRGAQRTPRGGMPPMYVPLRKSPYPARRMMALGSEACQLGEGGSRCFDTVLANPAATRYLIDVESGRLESARRALASGHVADTYPDFSPFQAWEPITLELTASALEAAEGRVPAAVQRTCGLLKWARALSVGTADIHQRTQAWSTREAASSLLLELRRRHPDVPLPLDCREAIKPAPPAEFDLCENARHEFRSNRRFQRRLSDAGPLTATFLLRVLGHPFSDDRLGRAWLAQRHAPFCSAAARDALAAGSAEAPRSDFAPTPLACIAAVHQCQTMKLPHLYRSSITRRWHEITNAQATQQLLDAAHARIGQGGTGPAPDIPGYAVSEDAAAQTWTLTLRFPEGGTHQRTIRLAMAGG